MLITYSSMRGLDNLMNLSCLTVPLMKFDFIYEVIRC